MDIFEQVFDKFFERLLAAVLLVSVIFAHKPLLHSLYDKISDPTLKTEVESFIEFALPIAFIGLATKTFRKKLWKLLIPELNFGGRWIGVSEYGWGIEVNPPDQNAPSAAEMDARSPRPLLTVVEFEQEMSVARLINGRSIYPQVSGVTWSSTSLTIHQGSNLEISLSYVVEEPLRRPVNALEIITVFPSHRRFGWRNLLSRSHRYPQMLRGRFEHAWNGEAQFLHRGDTYYARVNADELEKINSLAAQPDRSVQQVSDLASSLSSIDHDEELSGYFKLLLIKCLT
jgi:hypothetical protein